MSRKCMECGRTLITGRKYCWLHKRASQDKTMQETKIKKDDERFSSSILGIILKPYVLLFLIIWLFLWIFLGTEKFDELISNHFFLIIFLIIVYFVSYFYFVKRYFRRD